MQEQEEVQWKERWEVSQDHSWTVPGPEAKVPRAARENLPQAKEKGQEIGHTGSNNPRYCNWEHVAMAKKRRSARRRSNPYMKCMSGPKGQIHKEREKLKREEHIKTLTPKQSGVALSRAAKFCSKK